MCENLAKLVCKTSMLKSDDCRLKSLTPTNRNNSRCEDSAVSDVFLLIMQWLYFEKQHGGMYRYIPNIYSFYGEQMTSH